ncbi:hypothetical protein ABL78_1234 [Leptomonas seymouri]|uniref:Uncharacterized protein n=1 Tax=Leptomonas seymouri TaxID=5684 RepID=A0A0N1IM77_LEPSE|nr:hypothetical protein ABL78_1234 [Leptomonas seymouri]|eukprot:KPI89653.1 hypothetical protein ABL78_1234 [Leptomonas seymouri]
MWTRRKLFPTLEVPTAPQPAAVATPSFRRQQQSGARDFALDEDAYNFLVSLGYTLVPSLSPQEAAQLLAWALPPSWVDCKGSAASSSTSKASRYKDVLSALLNNANVLHACSQVEYFFCGTDNGQVFLLPLLPPHLLEALMAEIGDDLLPGLAERCRQEAELLQAARVDGASKAAKNGVPVNCVGRRLLHRHIREEPVTAIDHLGVVFASAASSVDHAVALSVFHPLPMGVVCIEHPCPVRSLKLWEGAVFTSESGSGELCCHGGGDAAGAHQRQRWSEQVREAEPAAIYVFTGSEAGLVRLWRVDVVRRTYSLQHVLVCSGNMAGMLSPLTPFAREDTTRKVPSRESDSVLHCLDIDVSSNRLFGGTEGGVYVWALDALPWRGPEETNTAARSPTSSNSNASENNDDAAPTSASLALRHPLCWDEDHRCPLPCALGCWAEAQWTAPSTSPTNSETVVGYRAARLANHHVWILNAPAVQAEMARAQQHQRQGGGDEKVCRWKPKYGRVITNGAAVGVVSNNVCLKEATAAVAVGGGEEKSSTGGVSSRLTNSVVTVTFDGGELKNDLLAPLSCVIPVVYPLARLRTPGTACFALRVLAPQRRIVTSCADGKVCVWVRKPSEDARAPETYVPQLVTDNRQEHRGLGRHLCVLRSPDVFVSCSFDDGLVKEWHVYDEPELLLRCARRFTLTPYVSSGPINGGGANGNAGSAKELSDMLKSIAQVGDGRDKKRADAADNRSDDDDEDMLKAAEGGDAVAGISCATAYPAFGAIFLVGTFESAIQSYSLTEVVGCEPPRNFIYNGHKTVHLPASMAEDVYREL